jgi:hypothetical protein
LVRLKHPIEVTETPPSKPPLAVAAVDDEVTPKGKASPQGRSKSVPRSREFPGTGKLYGTLRKLQDLGIDIRAVQNLRNQFIQLDSERTGVVAAERVVSGVKNMEMRETLSEYCVDAGMFIFSRLNEIIEHFYFTPINYKVF